MLWFIAAVFIVLKIVGVFTFAWPLVLIPVFVLAALILFQMVCALLGFLLVRKVRLKKTQNAGWGRW